MLWLLALLGSALAACPTTGTVHFMTSGETCHRADPGGPPPPARPLSIDVEFGRCYPAHYDCGGAPACSDGQDMDAVLTCGACEPTVSFRVQDGVLEVYTKSTDCTGLQHLTGGCLFGVISAGGLTQFDALDAVAASNCP